MLQYAVFHGWNAKEASCASKHNTNFINHNLYRILFTRAFASHVSFAVDTLAPAHSYEKLNDLVRRAPMARTNSGVM